jgi:hypothetical protein
LLFLITLVGDVGFKGLARPYLYRRLGLYLSWVHRYVLDVFCAYRARLHVYPPRIETPCSYEQASVNHRGSHVAVSQTSLCATGAQGKCGARLANCLPHDTDYGSDMTPCTMVYRYRCLEQTAVSFLRAEDMDSATILSRGSDFFWGGKSENVGFTDRPRIQVQERTSK